MKNKLKKILIVIALILIVLVASVGVTWRHEIATLLSIEQIRTRNDEHLDGSVYMMDVSGGFYLEDFIEQGGVKNDQELIDFIVGH